VALPYSSYFEKFYELRDKLAVLQKALKHSRISAAPFGVSHTTKVKG
jgi:hypothetical protein